MEMDMDREKKMFGSDAAYIIQKKLVFKRGTIRTPCTDDVFDLGGVLTPL
jgi:hypothetical protein